MRRLRSLTIFSLFAIVLVVSVPRHQPHTVVAQSQNSAFGVNSHVGSRHGNLTTIKEALDLVADTNTGWVREDFVWGLVDETRSGNYNWDVLDTVISDLSGRGINIIGLLNDAPGHAPIDAQSRQGFLAFVQTAVERYPAVTHWEVWNEPENALYWNPPDPAAYTSLLVEVSGIIKAANPNAKVLSAGVVPTHLDFIRGIHENGGWGAFDILALHPYVDPLTPESGQIGNGGDVSKVRSLVDELGTKPIWATEYGWSTGHADRLAGGGAPVDQATQANYLVRGAVLLRAAGLERIVWFKFKDENEGNRYGLFDLASGGTDFSQPKASYSAFTTLNEQLAGATPREALQPGQSSVVLDFNTPMEWRTGDANKGTLTHSTARARSGSAGELRYNATSSGNDFVGFNPPEEIPIPGAPSQLGIWVDGDGSGLELWAWLRDSQNEVLKYRLGIIGTGGWRFISTPLNETLLDWQVDNDVNRRVDFPAKLIGFAMEDNPDTDTGSGTIYLDDLTAMSSAYGVRFDKGGEVVDVLWALGNEQISLPTDSPQGTLVDRSGSESSITPSGGEFSLSLGPSPVYLRHAGGAVPVPTARPVHTTPTPTEESTTPTPTPSPGSVGQQPTPPPSTPTDPSACRTFDVTGYQVCGRILEYWTENGGLPVFGYPITPQRAETIEGQTFEVQWFERNRLELHPENARPYDVLLGRLGVDVLELDGRDWTDFATSAPQTGCRYFEETGQSACGEILAAWRANGLELDGVAGKTEGENLALFGMPISPLQEETIEGQTFQVQWFERARFELHPENAPPNNVLLGLLGNEIRDAGGVE